MAGVSVVVLLGVLGSCGSAFGAQAPTVSEAVASSVAASSATVTAEINPEGLPTSYRAEYASEAQFQAGEWAGATKVPIPDEELPAAETPEPVSESLSGLQASTTYHVRYVAGNSMGQVLGAGATFTTPPATGASTATALPDGRVDELVSNTGSEGELYTPTSPFGNFQNTGLIGTELVFQGVSDGEAVTYIGEPSFTNGNGSASSGEGNQWIARRTSSGWASEDISPPIALDEYQGFSSDLATGFFLGGLYSGLDLNPPLAPGVSPGCAALYSTASGSGRFSPLFTSGATNPGECGQSLFAGASEGGAQVIFQSEAALTPNAQEATEVPLGHEELHRDSVSGEACMFGCNLYDDAGGYLTLVNVLEENGVVRDVPNATFGGYAGGERQPTNFSNAISRDGSRVFWTDTQEGADFEHVYVFENGAGSVPVSVGAAEYWTATPDGRYAYYTQGGGLWRFDTQSNTREELAGSAANVQGVIGVSEDGSYVYFVAEGALASGATSRSCPKPISEYSIDRQETEAQEEQNLVGCNLYVLHDNTTTFITILSPEDRYDIQGSTESSEAGDWWPYVGKRVAEVTPDGRHLVFQSQRKLTGYDNVRTGSHEQALEAFVYSAEGDRLSCASCSPTGAPPSLNEGAELGAQYTKLTEGGVNATHLPRWLSDNGNRLFFMSGQPLVSGDTDGVQDVYEWEREGEGSCSVQSPARLNGGCVYLLSGGTSVSPSFLVEADASGSNVFFEHVGPLGGVVASADQNELFDARVGGGFPRTSLACSGAGCQGVPPAPPSFATPASVTFSGGGNFAPSPPVSPKMVKSVAQVRRERLAAALKACRRGRVRSRRVRCEQRARAKYGVKKPKQAKKASGSRKVGYERRAGA